MSNGILSKIKNMLTEEEDYYDDDDEMEAEVDEREDDLERNDMSTIRTSTSKVVNLHTSNSMKVVIVEPKKDEEVTTIADHLKQKKAVIVNLENLNDPGIRKSIFEFMNGAVYVLDGGIQKVSKGIFILAPNNVDIDSSIKKELESKAFFPWQK